MSSQKTVGSDYVVGTFPIVSQYGCSFRKISLRRKSSAAQPSKFSLVLCHFIQKNKKILKILSYFQMLFSSHFLQKFLNTSLCKQFIKNSVISHSISVRFSVRSPTVMPLIINLEAKEEFCQTADTKGFQHFNRQKISCCT